MFACVTQVGLALALWPWCSPLKALELETWIIETLGVPEGFNPVGGARQLALAKMQAALQGNGPKSWARFVASLGQDEQGRPYAGIIEQHAGHSVKVPPVALHMVFNVQACIKVAWDFYDVPNLHHYIQGWKQVNSRFFTAPAVAKDYTIVPEVVWRSAYSHMVTRADRPQLCWSSAV
jgi:hypothetical protein